MSFKGQRVVVLGGSSGLGLATAQAAAREGASVVIASSQEVRLKNALAELPFGTESHILDLGDEASIKALFQKIGEFDHLVFTAGDTPMVGDFLTHDVEAAQNYFRLRYWGAFMAVKYGHPYIRKGGSITLTGGMIGKRPRTQWSMPSSVITALEGLTRSLAVELAPLRINIVASGLTRTPIWDTILSEAEQDAMFDAAPARIPVGHVGLTSEIAEGYLYLMRQTYGTGQTLYVDGGASL